MPDQLSYPDCEVSSVSTLIVTGPWTAYAGVDASITSLGYIQVANADRGDGTFRLEYAIVNYGSPEETPPVTG